MYQYSDFEAHTFGRITGELWQGGEGYRDFDRRLYGVYRLPDVIAQECSQDFQGGGKVSKGYVEVTYHKSWNRAVVRLFPLTMFPSIAKYVSE